MYPRTKVLILLVLALTVFSCSSLKKKSNDERISIIDTNDLIEDIYMDRNILVNEFYTDNAQFRLDYNGQLRSLKASYAYKLDSFIYVKLRTPFGKSVASFIANPKSIVFEDYQIERAYFIDYETLSQLIRIPINFNLLQKLFIASYNLEKSNVDFVTSDSLSSDFSVYKKLSYINDTVTLNEILHFNLNPLFIKQWELHSQESDNTFNATYEWNNNFSKVHPKYLDILFNYDNTPVEIEFDFKSIYPDSLITYKLDTTLMPEIILFKE